MRGEEEEETTFVRVEYGEVKIEGKGKGVGRAWGMGKLLDF